MRSLRHFLDTKKLETATYHSAQKNEFEVMLYAGVLRITRMVTHLSLVGLVVTLLSCAGMDNWLEERPPSPSSEKKEQESWVIFHGNILERNIDTLVILALKDASVPSGGPGLRQDLVFYFKNTNRWVPILSQTNQSMSNFLRFESIDRKSLTIFRKDLSQLEGLQIYAIYLRGLTVNEEELESYKIIGDADFKDIHHLNVQMMSQRQIFFILRKLNKEQSKICRRMVVDTFEPYNPEEDYRQ